MEKLLCCMQAKSSVRKKSNRASQRDLDTRIEFMEGIVRRDPDYVDALQLLGDDYTQRGRFPEGLQVDERLASLEPQNSLVFYNLACSYSLTGQFDRALAALEKAFDYRGDVTLTLKSGERIEAYPARLDAFTTRNHAI